MGCTPALEAAVALDYVIGCVSRSRCCDYNAAFIDGVVNMGVQAFRSDPSMQLTMVQVACSHCKEKRANCKTCGGCKTARYCSRQCQKLAWKQGHKPVCAEQRKVYDEAKLGGWEPTMAKDICRRGGCDFGPCTPDLMKRHCALMHPKADYRDVRQRDPNEPPPIVINMAGI